MGLTAEYDIQVAMTAEFIATDPETVVMNRRERVRNPSTGAWTWVDDVPGDPQTVRIMEPPTTAVQVREVSIPGGEAVMPELYLLATPDADIKAKDWFVWRGVNWQIDSVHFKPDYELRGDVVRYVSEV